jgi:hypothetical protein
MSASGPAKLLDIKQMKASELVGLMDEGRSKFAHSFLPSVFDAARASARKR